MKIEKFHHVAYRCKDAKQTVEWYAQHLNMDFVLAMTGTPVENSISDLWAITDIVHTAEK